MYNTYSMQVMWFCVGLFLHLRNTADSSRILAFTGFPSYSHQVIFNSIWRELSLRGHDVTVVTPVPTRDPSLTNLTEIDVGFARKVLHDNNWVDKMAKDSFITTKVYYVLTIMNDLTEKEMQHEDFQKLFKLPERHFDLVIVQACSPLVYALGAKFKAPIVVISSMPTLPNIQEALGVPTHPVLSPNYLINPEGDMTLFAKIQSLFFEIIFRIIYKWIILPKSEAVAREFLGDIPPLGDIERNISLMFMNNNPFLHPIRANVPALIEMNQVHITSERKPLPKDIKEFLDSAPRGVVYFSLGSNVKSSSLPPKTRDVIIQALRELPYKVLWKWETDTLPNQPSNVMARKWLQQQDILSHPNVKVFISQGGLQSIEEAMAYAIPMVGLPFISDQPANIKKITHLGIGLGLDPSTMSKEQFRNAIIEVASNSRFKKKIMEIRSILVDQPMKGVAKVVWWMEYVIRHKGARHLHYPAADMSFYEYFMVDVFLFLFTCFLVFIYVIIKMSRLVRTMVNTRKVKIN